MGHQGNQVLHRKKPQGREGNRLEAGWGQNSRRGSSHHWALKKVLILLQTHIHTGGAALRQVGHEGYLPAKKGIGINFESET